MAKKAPDPTPPKETSAAQTSSSVSTAIANAFLQNPTEITPDGSTRVNQSGNYVLKDPYTGKTYNVPTFTRTTTLSPQQQAIKNQTDRASLNLATLGANQSSRVDDLLSEPFNPDNVDAPSLTTDFSADRQRVEDALMERLNPQLSRDREALRTQLSSQGIKLGSTAYDRGMEDIGKQANDARLAAILNAGQEQSRLTQMNNATRAQAMQEAYAARNQPINEIMALASGSQVQQPSFMGANIGPIPTTDNAGIIQNYDQQRIAAAQQDNAFTQNILGGLFGLGAAGIYASDKRVKKDIEKVGELKGHNIYEYHYKGDPKGAPKSIGVMAQEVEKKKPGAVIDGPIKRVNYGALFGTGAA